MGPLIEFAGQALINFRHHAFDQPSHHGYRWVDIKRYRVLGGPAADEHLLRALIDDDQFADGYAGAGAEPSLGIHGPYRLDGITPAAYEPVDAAVAVSVIDAWARQFGDLPGSLADALEAQLYAPARQAVSRYRLGDLDPDARHEWAGIHIDFHELVIMDLAADTVLLAVAADD